MKYLKLSVYEFLYSSIFIHATNIALDRLPTHAHTQRHTHTHFVENEAKCNSAVCNVPMSNQKVVKA